MRVLLVGQESGEIRGLVQELGFEIVESAAEACICYGGDGTLLGAEHRWPGLPKIPLRRKEGADGIYRRVLERVVSGTVVEHRLPKISASNQGRTLHALNDIVLHNTNALSAVRYRVWINGVEHLGEIVGDGLVVATPFGSSAYYRAITNSVIHVGIGLAFNNSTEPVNHLVLGEDVRIRVRITRGPAVLGADNNPIVFTLMANDEIEIQLSNQAAVIWEIENLLSMSDPEIEYGRRLRWLPTFSGRTIELRRQGNVPS